MNRERFEVAVIGAGPTGLVLGNLLGAMGVSTIVIERDREVFPIPRATHMDEETLRNLALTGLFDRLSSHISPFGNMEVADANGRAFLTETVGLNVHLHGRKGAFFFDQPAMERVLRDGLGRFPNVEFRTGFEVRDIAQDAQGVELSVISTDGDKLKVSASYAVGCDGGRSRVREQLGIGWKSLAPPSRWLIVDTLLRDVDDAALLPPNFQYRMGRGRLMLYAHGHGLNRRWEFRLDDNEPQPSERQVAQWVSAFIDPERLKVTRLTTYTQNALVAERWREGRVLLAGDAAHLMPPAAGQGMCSGIRDAVNLAWKLQHVLQDGHLTEGLNTYYGEREPHLVQMLKGSIFIGNRLDAPSVFGRWAKYWQLRAIARFPMLSERLRSHLIRPIPFTDGFVDTASGGGQHLPCFIDENGSSDALWPYGWAVIADRDAFGPSLSLRLADMGIAAVGNRPQDRTFMPAMLRWLKEQHADLAIVRPDCIVYAFTNPASIHGHLDVLEMSGVGRASLMEAMARRVMVA